MYDYDVITNLDREVERIRDEEHCGRYDDKDEDEDGAEAHSNPNDVTQDEDINYFYEEENDNYSDF